jgi:hypothetical protein
VSTVLQFEYNLKRLKQYTIGLAHENKPNNEKALLEVEAKLDYWYNIDGFGCLTKDSKLEVNLLEDREERF